jgi:hypothetical protein
MDEDYTGNQCGNGRWELGIGTLAFVLVLDLGSFCFFWFV